MSRHEVKRYMTAEPVVTHSATTVADAHQIMRERGIRHLPVVDGGRLVGLVSQRDIYLLETLRGVDAASETVEEAMTPEPYAVSPETPLEDVARTMAERKFGSAIVVERGAVVGVFTTTDALRALSSMLRRRNAGPRAE